LIPAWTGKTKRRREPAFCVLRYCDINCKDCHYGDCNINRGHCGRGLLQPVPAAAQLWGG